ncbi:MAG: copper resistance protein CopC [Rhodoglobus sp.]|nr:copper resistance protein CopC [Rhodoglobus sp.]
MHRRSIARAAAAFTAGALLALAAPLAASAHDTLVSSTPSDGSTITGLPDAFSVTMNEPLGDLTGNGSGFAIEVRDAAGAYYGDGCFTIADATLATAAALGAPGNYTLLWQVVSADGHIASGELRFAWAPADGSTASPGSATPPVCGATADPTAPATPMAIPTKQAHADADLSSVLWIGGAIGAVLGAGLVTFLVLGRRKRA